MDSKKNDCSARERAENCLRIDDKFSSCIFLNFKMIKGLLLNLILLYTVVCCPGFGGDPDPPGPKPKIGIVIGTNMSILEITGNGFIFEYKSIFGPTCKQSIGFVTNDVVNQHEYCHAMNRIVHFLNIGQKRVTWTKTDIKKSTFYAIIATLSENKVKVDYRVLGDEMSLDFGEMGFKIKINF